MTPHFTNAELACKCGCGLLPELDFMLKVETLRARVGFKLPVTSGARCPKRNSRVSGTGEDGPHTTRRAIDLAISRQQAYIVMREALALGFTGMGFNQKGDARFLHLDDLPDAPGQPRPTVWSY